MRWDATRTYTYPEVRTHELRVRTLGGCVLTLEVAPTGTVGKLKSMLLDKKISADSKEFRELLGAQVLVDNKVLSDDDQTLECLGLLDTESDVMVVYSRKKSDTGVPSWRNSRKKIG